MRSPAWGGSTVITRTVFPVDCDVIRGPPGLPGRNVSTDGLVEVGGVHRDDALECLGVHTGDEVRATLAGLLRCRDRSVAETQDVPCGVELNFPLVEIPLALPLDPVEFGLTWWRVADRFDQSHELVGCPNRAGGVEIESPNAAE